jgi:2-C-methyl-D-erythritol 4-phosphate cytidylyltransferase
MGPVTAVLLAGGQGFRAGSTTPKQFLDLAGRPLLVHSLLVFEATPEVTSVVVVLPDEVPDFVRGAIALPKVVSVTTGGAIRQASLAEGLACLPEETEVVVVHDAARPLVSPGLVGASLEALADWDGVVVAVPVEDAVKEVSSTSEIVRARTRSGLWRAQTPQVFLREALEDALARADAEGLVADDCSELATRAGYRVRVVPGDPWNLKVTRPQDLALCERIIESRGGASWLQRAAT